MSTTPNGAPGEHADDMPAEPQGFYTNVEELGQYEPVEPGLHLVDMAPLLARDELTEETPFPDCVRPDTTPCPYGTAGVEARPESFLWFSGPEMQTGARFGIECEEPIEDGQLTQQMTEDLEAGRGMLDHGNNTPLEDWRHKLDFMVSQGDEFAKDTQEIINETIENTNTTQINETNNETIEDVVVEEINFEFFTLENTYILGETIYFYILPTNTTYTINITPLTGTLQNLEFTPTQTGIYNITSTLEFENQSESFS